MPNQPKPGHRPVSMRLAPDLLARVEQAVVAFKAKHPGVKYDRTDVIRGLIVKHLPPVDAPPEKLTRKR